MSMLRTAAIGLIATLLLPTGAIGQDRQDDGAAPANGSALADGTARLVIATADLAGADKELSKFLTDTLITDLGRSTKLAPLERATVQQCFTRLQLAPDSALTAGDARRLGAFCQADRVLVGSYMVRDEQLIINARMLDSKTGLMVPGGAMSASGNRNDLLSISHRLAQQLHKRLTNTDLVFEDAPPSETHAPGSGSYGVTEAVATVKTPAPVVDDLQVLKHQGLIPAAAKPNAVLSDADLAGLIKSVAKCVTPQSESAETLTLANAPVTRVRALAAMIKLLVAPDDLANYKQAPPAHMPADAAQTPAWGAPYLAAAVDQGWWPADRPICPKDPATWAFVATLLTRLPLHAAEGGQAAAPAQAPGDPPALVDTDADPYSGLVIDALDLTVERAMSPRILDEAGRVIYPDPGHVPSDDYIQDHGMVSYYSAVADARRAGKHPLVVHATRVSEHGHDDITVSNETAELIREANRRGKFLYKWNVAIVVGKGQPVAQTPPGAAPSP